MKQQELWGWDNAKLCENDEELPIDGRELVKKLRHLLHSDNLKTFFPDELDKQYKARFELFCRSRGDYMNYDEVVEFLTSINNVMSRKSL